MEMIDVRFVPFGKNNGVVWADNVEDNPNSERSRGRCLNQWLAANRKAELEALLLPGDTTNDAAAAGRNKETFRSLGVVSGWSLVVGDPGIFFWNRDLVRFGAI